MNTTGDTGDRPSSDEPGRQLPAWAWRAAGLAVGVLWVADAGAGIVSALSPLLVTGLVSFLLACTLEPPVSALARRGIRRGVSTFVLLGAIAGIGVVAVGGAGAVVVSQYSAVLTGAPEMVGQAGAALNELFGTSLDVDALTQRARTLFDEARLGERLGDQLGGGVGRGVGFALAGLLLVFYLVADGPKARRAVCSLLPAARQVEVLRAWELAIDKAGGWLLGRAVLATITASASTVCFVLLGLDHPIPLGLWVGLATHLIPLVGSWLGAAVPLVVALAHSPGRALGVVVFLVVFNYLRNLVIGPRVVRVTLRIHPAVGFVSVIGAGLLFGPAVALVALPTVATVQAFAGSYLRRHDVVDDPLTRHPASSRRGVRTGEEPPTEP